MLPLAVSDHEGTVTLRIDADDSGGTRIDRDAAAGRAETVSVPCRPLLAILDDAGFTTIDALKIDVEGAEDLVLVPFLRDAPSGLLPGVVLIEDTSGQWRTDVFALLAQHGYTVVHAQPPECGAAARVGHDGGCGESATGSAAPSIARRWSGWPTGWRSRSWSRCRGRPRSRRS